MCQQYKKPGTTKWEGKTQFIINQVLILMVPEMCGINTIRYALKVETKVILNVQSTNHFNNVAPIIND